MKQFTFAHYFLSLIFLFCSNGDLTAQDNARYVDLFIGTSGDNGQVDPAACVPYGMVRVCPDSKPRSHSGYDYSVTTISGFSINRLSGIGCGGNGGNLSLKPCDENETLRLEKSTEKATPGFYGVTLSNGVKVECTATQKVGIERFYYPAGKPAVMSLNMYASFTGIIDAFYEIVSDKEIRGYVKAGTTCNNGAYKLYFSLTTSKAFKKRSAGKQLVVVEFANANNTPIEIRIALSPVNTEVAGKENQLFAHKDFTQVKSMASRQWNNLLNRITSKGGAEEDKKLFYTSLYRVFLSPFNATSIDKKYVGTDGEVHEANNFTYYSSWSIWDSYRTKFPLITLLDPVTMTGIGQSLSKLYKHGKKDWATPFESTPTVRTEHALCVLLDAWRKGIKGLDLREGYEEMQKEVDRLQVTRPDQALETAIDYWAMGNIAAELGRLEDASKYAVKARELFTFTWEKEFKNVDSSFRKMRNNGLYQGSRWQYRWALPQFTEEMAAASGGKEKLAEQLAVFFDSSLNNQGNEVGIHAPFLFNRLGSPQRTQQVVTTMLTKEMRHLYGGNAEYPAPVFSKIFKANPEGFLPEMDEDDGTMSAWYVFAALGIFPLVTGEPGYEISSPLFPEITIRLEHKTKLIIKTVNRHTMNDIIKEVRWNGRKVQNYNISHSLLMKGGTLELIY